MFTIVQLLTSLFQDKQLKKYLPYLIFGLCVFGGYKYLNYKAYNEGVKDTEGKYQKMLKEAEETSRLRITYLQEQVDTYSKDLEKKQIENQISYEKGKQDAEKIANDVLSAMESDARRLSLDVNTCRAETRKAKSTRHPSPTSNTITRATLSERSARFLVVNATQADNTIRELNLCKKTLWDYKAAVDNYNKQMGSK